jgi:hypothetical protein
MVYPGTLFIGDNGAFLCIPMKIGVKFEHCKNCANVAARNSLAGVRCGECHGRDAAGRTAGDPL